jgi:hypothetical protein
MHYPSEYGHFVKEIASAMAEMTERMAQVVGPARATVLVLIILLMALLFCTFLIWSMEGLLISGFHDLFLAAALAAMGWLIRLLARTNGQMCNSSDLRISGVVGFDEDSIVSDRELACGLKGPKERLVLLRDKRDVLETHLISAREQTERIPTPRKSITALVTTGTGLFTLYSAPTIYSVFAGGMDMHCSRGSCPL